MEFIKRNPKIFVISGKARSGKNEISKIYINTPLGLRSFNAFSIKNIETLNLLFPCLFCTKSKVL